MTVAYDAISAVAAETRCGSPQTMTWTHTPVGTPKGIVVFLTVGGTTVASADNAITSVTYGGVAMTKVNEAHNSVSESVTVYMYELLSGIPTGAQSIVATMNACPLTVSGGYPWWWGRGVSMTSGGGALSRLASNTLSSSSTTAPSITLDAGSTTGLALMGLNSGYTPHSSLSATAGVTTAASRDFAGGAISDALGRQTTPATGSFSIGWTQAANVAAAVAASYGEVVASSTKKMGPMGFFG